MASTVRRTRGVRGLCGVCAVAVIAIASTATAEASVETWCADELGGAWNGQNCSTSVLSPRNATMSISANVPPDLQENPTAGPVVRGYVKNLVDGWRNTGANMVRDSTYSVDYQMYSHGSVKSVVFHEFWQTIGAPPNDAYRTFTFDVARGRRLELADLFNPGVDPLTALPPLVRPYLSASLDAAAPPHDPGTYPFTPQEWEPMPDGSGFSGDYRAFAISDSELILYMPGAPMSHENPFPRDRFVWSMDGGTVVVHVPLAALASILRPL